MLDLSYMIHDMTDTKNIERTEKRNPFSGESIMLTQQEARSMTEYSLMN
jgi:hypothetical protein